MHQDMMIYKDEQADAKTKSILHDSYVYLKISSSPEFMYCFVY